MLGTNVLNSKDVILGAGVLYFNNINCGQLKGDVSFTPTADYKEFKAGVPQQTIKIVKFSEGAALKASIAEMNVANFARAMNISSSAVTSTTGAVTTESVVMTGTETATVAKGRGITNLVVKKGGATAVLDTDYEIVSAEGGQFRRKSGSSLITDGDTVSVAYTYVKSSVVPFGGGAQPADVPAKFVYTSPDGDMTITIEFPKAQWKAGNAITFKEEEFSTSDVEIVAVSDSTKTAGSQLGTVTFTYYQ